MIVCFCGVQSSILRFSFCGKDLLLFVLAQIYRDLRPIEEGKVPCVMYRIKWKGVCFTTLFVFVFVLFMFTFFVIKIFVLSFNLSMYNSLYKK